MLHIAISQDYHYKKTKLDFWDEKYGFSFKPFKALQMEEPLLDFVGQSNVVTDVALLKEFNLEFHNKEDIEFDTEYKLKMTRKETLTVGFSRYI